jgi:hypothetical protein
MGREQAAPPGLAWKRAVSGFTEKQKIASLILKKQAA